MFFSSFSNTLFVLFLLFLDTHLHSTKYTVQWQQKFIQRSKRREKEEAAKSFLCLNSFPEAIHFKTQVLFFFFFVLMLLYPFSIRFQDKLDTQATGVR